MKANTNTSGSSVTGDVVRSAAAGVQDAWDMIVEAYAGLVWAVACDHALTSPGAAEVSRLTWMRFRDRLDSISVEAIADWLAQTAERECVRMARLCQVGGEAQVRTA
jgi:hypothetical protein